MRNDVPALLIKIFVTKLKSILLNLVSFLRQTCVNLTLLLGNKLVLLCHTFVSNFVALVLYSAVKAAIKWHFFMFMT